MHSALLCHHSLPASGAASALPVSASSSSCPLPLEVVSSETIDHIGRGEPIEKAEVILGLRNSEFFLAYQPQFSIGNQGCTVSGVEALIRWSHPRLGELLPARFLQLVADADLEFELSEYVLRTAVRQIRSWLDSEGWSPRVAINMAPRLLSSPNLCRDTLAELSSAGVSASLLEVEVLESAVIGDPDRTARELKALREAGVSVAIDDFGTGFSCFNYLLQFPLDTIKICSSFVHGIGQGTGADEVCTAIIQLGRSLGKRVVAEGVETPAQLGFLRLHGCDSAQGYLLAKPMSHHALASSFFGAVEPIGAPALVSDGRHSPLRGCSRS